MTHVALTAEDVRERLSFARRRKEELIGLNGGDLPGADPHFRQQLVQEFFFHLVGAIEVLAQLVNEARNLGLGVEDASSKEVIKRLLQADVLRAPFALLYANTRERAPSNPYSDEGLIYRIWNYRHQVTHRRRQPFQFNIGISTAIDFGGGIRGRWREFRYRRAPDSNPQAPAPVRTSSWILANRLVSIPPRCTACRTSSNACCSLLRQDAKPSLV